MVAGAVNFAFTYNLLTRKIRKAFSWEIIIFFLIIIAGTSAFHCLVMSKCWFTLPRCQHVSSAGSVHTSFSLSSTLYSFSLLNAHWRLCFSMQGIRFPGWFLSQNLERSVKAVLVKEHVISSERINRKQFRWLFGAPFTPVIVILFAAVLSYSRDITTIGVSLPTRFSR